MLTVYGEERFLQHGGGQGGAQVVAQAGGQGAGMGMGMGAGHGQHIGGGGTYSHTCCWLWTVAGGGAGIGGAGIAGAWGAWWWTVWWCTWVMWCICCGGGGGGGGGIQQVDTHAGAQYEGHPYPQGFASLFSRNTKIKNHQISYFSFYRR